MFTNNLHAQGWFALNSGTGNTLTEIYFVDENTGWISGSNGLILKSTNGGINWSTQTSNTFQTLWALFFIDENVGWVIGDGGLTKRTTRRRDHLDRSAGESASLLLVFLLLFLFGTYHFHKFINRLDSPAVAVRSAND
ncbi:MAG: hypothetical protein IPG02_17650 [Ignavibacteria bacterium]|nr:hypothetical protein [Ignavibacteria bacterium]